MTNEKKTGSRAFTASILLSLFTQCAAAFHPTGVESRFVLHKSAFVLGEPIWVSFVVSNHTGGAIGFRSFHRADGDFDFRVLEPPTGFSYQRPYGVLGSGMAEGTRIGPATSHTTDILLGDYVWIREPGTYTVRCGATFPILDGATGGAIQTNITGLLKFTVDKNDNQLAVIVSELTAQLKVFGQRDRAALAITTIYHPLALPCLAELLYDSDGAIVQRSLKCIENINDERAKSVLRAYTERDRLGHAQSNLVMKTSQKAFELVETLNDRTIYHGYEVTDGAAAKLSSTAKAIENRLRSGTISLDLRQPMLFGDLLAYLAIKGRCNIVMVQMAAANRSLPRKITGKTSSFSLWLHGEGPDLSVKLTAKQASILAVLEDVVVATGLAYRIESGNVLIMPAKPDM